MINMSKPKLNKLTEQVINQIAAGEVIERPSSVVKELIDNAVDAQASKIEIKIKNGGLDLIEVSDNGIGIPSENMSLIFDSHTTSKIKDIEDLNTLLSMGFRGEALSTITSVSEVILTSKYEQEEFGSEIKFDEKGKSEVKKTAKERGSTVRVENIFYNVPARRKYLKTAQTEYRKIYELLCNYFLIYPNIRFTLEKDGKVSKNLPSVINANSGEITKERVEEVVGESENFLKLFYEGSGIKVSGYIAHPSTHSSRSSKLYIFVNNRPVVDRGIVRAVYEGYSRYLPYGEKIDFVVNIKINPEIVDVNVHPRKEEVRFENPYRVYSAIESAVKHTLEKEFSFSDVSSDSSKRDFASMRKSFRSSDSEPKQYQSPNIYMGKRSNSVKDSLLFSKELLEQKPQPDQDLLLGSEENGIVNMFQVFNKYIVIEFNNEELWIVDQHAAAERINFEKLLRGKDKIDIQSYLVPVTVKLKEEEAMFLKEFKEFFSNIGIEYDLEEKGVKLKSVPVEFANSDFSEVFKEIFSLEDDTETLTKNFKRLKENVLATISCHSSIRSGQKLSKEEMYNIYSDLLHCRNPYSCPHGRPAVWKLTLKEIDSNFERTY